MTVKELIKYLSMVQNQDKDVFVWEDGLLWPVKSVDLCVTDRVDIMIGEEQ